MREEDEGPFLSFHFANEPPGRCEHVHKADKKETCCNDMPDWFRHTCFSPNYMFAFHAESVVVVSSAKEPRGRYDKVRTVENKESASCDIPESHPYPPTRSPEIIFTLNADSVVAQSRLSTCSGAGKAIHSTASRDASSLLAELLAAFEPHPGKVLGSN
jgi:hypothetical protein